MATTDHPIIERICSTCKLAKPLEAFHRSNRRLIGRQRICKTCTAIRSAVRLYGLTWEQATELRARTHCEICGSEARLDIDHDHETGRVRGVLCRRCNLGLGFLENDNFLTKAVAYLARH